MFFKRNESASHSGCVERIGAYQESSGDTAQPCHALLLKGHAQPLILKTDQGPGEGKYAAVIGIRIRIALTTPGDNIKFEIKGGNVITYQNETLEHRIVSNSTASLIT